MNWENLDRYLLHGEPPKADVIEGLLASRSEMPGAAAFFRGIEMLGAKTPDLTLLALRLVLAGKKADDASVVRLRAAADRARSGDAGAAEEYHAQLA